MKNLKTSVYLAARYPRRAEMEEIADYLKDVGYDICARWVYGGEEGLSREDIAVLDIEDVEKADVVISYTEPYGTLAPGGGRHVEFGYAYALGTRCVVIGERENVFHHLPLVEVYPTLIDFIKKDLDL